MIDFYKKLLYKKKRGSIKPYESKISFFAFDPNFLNLPIEFKIKRILFKASLKSVNHREI